MRAEIPGLGEVADGVRNPEEGLGERRPVVCGGAGAAGAGQGSVAPSVRPCRMATRDDKAYEDELKMAQNNGLRCAIRFKIQALRNSVLAYIDTHPRS